MVTIFHIIFHSIFSPLLFVPCQIDENEPKMSQECKNGYINNPIVSRKSGEGFTGTRHFKFNPTPIPKGKCTILTSDEWYITHVTFSNNHSYVTMCDLHVNICGSTRLTMAAVFTVTVQPNIRQYFGRVGLKL